MENRKLYLIIQRYGFYYDVGKIIIGVASTKEKAMSLKKKRDKETIINENDFPMTEDEYYFYNCGYDENGKLVDCDKYTVSDFEKMSHLLDIKYTNFYECEIMEIKENEECFL